MVRGGRYVLPNAPGYSADLRPDDRMVWEVWSDRADFAVAAGAVTVVVTTAPTEVITAVAGLALLATLASALTAATADPERRFAAVVTFVVAGSGLSVGGIGAPFWALVAGLLVTALERRR